MAKLSANGCFKKAGFRVSIPDNLGADPSEQTWYYKYALRSDGAVMVSTARTVHGRVHWNDGGSYRIIGTMKKGAAATGDDLRSYIERRHADSQITKAA